MFSLSPRHAGRSDSDFVSNINTSSTENSNNNLSASSTSSHETAIHNATLSSHDDATTTEIGAISAALPAVLCGLPHNRFKPKTHASDQKNSVDEIAEHRIAIFGIIVAANTSARFPRRPSDFLSASRSPLTQSIFPPLRDHKTSRLMGNDFVSLSSIERFLSSENCFGNFYKLCES